MATVYIQNINKNYSEYRIDKNCIPMTLEI